MAQRLPTWLDPSKELKDIEKPEWFSKLSRPQADAVFYLWVIDAFYNAGKSEGFPEISADQLTEIAANAAVETGHGQKWNGNNWGGVKINKPYVTSYFTQHQTNPCWFQSKGHVSGGDEEIVYYIGFESVQDFAAFWLNRFVPFSYRDEEQIEEKKRSRYYKTAKAFWENFEEPTKHWFYELCVSGYKGEVTKKDPQPSVATLFSCKSRIKTMVSQLILGLTTDGVWGTKSKNACLEFQKNKGLQETGELNYETYNAIINSYFTLSEYSKRLNLKF